jgi:diguanylate cyclase (GGDEF)-like protein
VSKKKYFNPRGSGLFIVIAIILFINLALTNTIAYMTMRNNLRDSIIENDLPIRSSWIYSQIKLEIQPSILASASMANDMFLKKWIAEGEKDPAFLIKYLESIRDLHNGMTCFLVSEKSRTYYNMNGAYPIMEGDEDAEWYFSFLKSNRKSIINTSVNVDMDNLPTVFINYRIMSDEAETLGLSGIGIDLHTIPKLLSQYSEDFNRDIYFTNSFGDIIARSSDASIKADNIIDVPALKDHINNILEKENGIFELEISNEPQIMHSMYVPELDWWLLSVQRESVALDLMYRLIFSVMTINIVAIILTLLSVSLSVKHFQKRLQDMATLDSLTGVSNRQIFEYSLRQVFVNNRRKHITLSLLIIDIDFFKKINDSYGHIEGDQALIKTVQQIQNCIRKSDEISRWGGEEFVVLAYDCNLSQGLELSEKIRLSIIEASIAQYPNGEDLSVSIGLSVLQERDNIKSLFNRADSALYTAKSEGRNCVRSQ